MKKEFEESGILRPAIYLVLKGYSLGEKNLKTGRKKVTYYSFAIPEETLEKIEKMEQSGWILKDGFEIEFSSEQREFINNLKTDEKRKFGKEVARQNVLKYVGKRFFGWDATRREKVNYRLTNEDELEL